MPLHTAVATVKWTLDHQRKQGLPPARVSRFAAVGLGMMPSDTGFRMARTLAILVVTGGYIAVVGVLIVKVIPTLAGDHGG